MLDLLSLEEIRNKKEKVGMPEKVKEIIENKVKIEKLKVKKGIPEGFSYGEFAPGDGNEGGILPVHSLEKKESAVEAFLSEEGFTPGVFPQPIELKNEWEFDKLVKNGILFPCGCVHNGLWRKKSGCKFGDFEAHKAKYGI
jgi:hypothetical protein